MVVVGGDVSVVGVTAGEIQDELSEQENRYTCGERRTQEPSSFHTTSDN